MKPEPKTILKVQKKMELAYLRALKKDVNPYSFITPNETPSNEILTYEQWILAIDYLKSVVAYQKTQGKDFELVFIPHPKPRLFIRPRVGDISVAEQSLKGLNA